jgi:hypothetical protein
VRHHHRVMRCVDCGSLLECLYFLFPSLLPPGLTGRLMTSEEDYAEADSVAVGEVKELKNLVR